MNIIEATKKALAIDKWITRDSEEFCGCAIKPTDTQDCFIVKVIDNPEKAPVPRWNPCASDILAEDYKLID